MHDRGGMRFAVATIACLTMLAAGCSSKKVATSATPSASPSVTATATATPTPTPTATATATAAPAPRVTPSASPSPKAPPSPSPKASPSAPALSGSATIFAAASLTGAFNKIDADFMAAHPGVKLTPNYNGSGSLVTQIQQGAPADVFASADTANMDKLTGSGAIASSQPFARNLLEIVVQNGNPKGIHSLADLARPDLVVVLGDPATVPAGKYAKQALQAAGVNVAPKSLESQVTAVVQKVALAEADAGIVYVTDVKAAEAAGQHVDGVPIPPEQNVVAVYPIGILKNAANPAVAQAFVAYVLSPPGQATLASFGFLPPS